MRARFDSQADALSIDLELVETWDGAVTVGPDYCVVAIAGGRPTKVRLLGPVEHIGSLARVAQRFDLDLHALMAAAWAALAAPDRAVDIEVEVRLDVMRGETAELSPTTS